MSLIDLLRGVGTIVLIAAVAGAIAYAGDRVGHQVGRRRLTLFNIRPRYTSTIIAVGTGVLIALTVTLAAILASRQVQTAFFKLNAINAQIDELQARQHELESKVTGGQLIVSINSLMNQTLAIVRQTDSAQQRIVKVRQYYFDTVRYLNSTYTPLGLRPYVVPANVNKVLDEFATDPRMLAALSTSDVIVIATSDQNLFVNDPIHFQLEVAPDQLKFNSGQPIAREVIQGAHNANAAYALGQLQRSVVINAERAGMPAYFAGNVLTLRVLPDLTQMQQMLARPGLYVMTAYAAQDIYPHTGGLPFYVTLGTAPRR
jgi:Protein of unknown function (DUF3084)